MKAVHELELYLHIPFCMQKCGYCDFLSAPADERTKGAYMEALLEEVRGRGLELQRGAELQRDVGLQRDVECRVVTEEESAGEEYLITSVFIGGGTPSAVEPVWIERLMDAVRNNFRLAEGAEVTMEMNPGTAAEPAFAVYRAAGINRLSIGMQSADEKELKRLGRIHDFRQFLECYRMAREAGFDNINVDLMSALPGQSREDHLRDLQAVLALDPIPEHISAYSLIVEEGTPFYELQQNGALELPDEDTERQMYWDTAQRLEQAGYEHYEISNYALPGYACRHNCGYWRRTDYLGLGVGAASLFNNERYLNAKNIRQYIADPLNCRVERQSLSIPEQMEETMFLGLRMMDGVSFADFRAQFGTELESVYGNVLEKGARDGLLERKDGCVALTPRGIDLSNLIMAEFLF